MTEHELLIWLERWFRINTPFSVDPASPRSEVWLLREGGPPYDGDIKLFDLRDLAESFFRACQ